MFETSSDDLFLPPFHEEMVDNLLSNESSDDCGSSSLAEALLPLVESSASPLAPWVCSTRYKTELCTSYAASGLCKYAERCQFAHGLQELHVPYRHPKYKTELCRSFHNTGYCYYGTRCLFVHGATEQRPACRHRRKNVPCRTYRSYGVCPFGMRCNFLHVDEEGDGVAAAAAAESPVSCGRGGSSSSCGSSVNGAEETSPAELLSPTFQAQAKEWKPRGALCRTFSSFGFCLYGTRCRFQHGLPSKLKGSDAGLSPAGFQATVGSRALSQSYTDLLLLSSPFSPASSSSSSSSSSSNSSPPPSSTCTPCVTTPPVEAGAGAHNAFTFSSQHLNELLLPLALHLQQLESSQALASSAQKIWDNRAL